MLFDAKFISYKVRIYGLEYEPSHLVNTAFRKCHLPDKETSLFSCVVGDVLIVLSNWALNLFALYLALGDTIKCHRLLPKNAPCEDKVY